MIRLLLQPLARLPLRWLHACGAMLGWIVYFASPVYAARLRANLSQSGLAPGPDAYRALLHASIAEAGKGFFELPALWLRDEASVARLVVQCDHMEVYQAAQQRGKGIIFLTPHLGCFEVCAVYAAQYSPITILYRPPKIKWLAPLLAGARGRGGVRLATTDLWGVRKLYLAIKRAEAVGMLPDPAPGFGDGVWAPFLGRQAYTMTLGLRLRESTGAAVILAFAERLPAGRGYRIHMHELPAEARDAAALNRAIEQLIRACPAQYLWSYNRYKTPAGAK